MHWDGAVDVPELKRNCSAALLLTRPGRTLPPPLFHLGNSAEAPATFPRLRSVVRVEERKAPHPTLKVKDTRAEYWLAVRPEYVMALDTQFSYERKSSLRRASPVAAVKGTEYFPLMGTVQERAWQAWP